MACETSQRGHLRSILKNEVNYRSERWTLFSISYFADMADTDQNNSGISTKRWVTKTWNNVDIMGLLCYDE